MIYNISYRKFINKEVAVKNQTLNRKYSESSENSDQIIAFGTRK